MHVASKHTVYLWQKAAQLKPLANISTKLFFVIKRVCEGSRGKFVLIVVVVALNEIFSNRWEHMEKKGRNCWWKNTKTTTNKAAQIITK